MKLIHHKWGKWPKDSKLSLVFHFEESDGFIWSYLEKEDVPGFYFLFNPRLPRNVTRQQLIRPVTSPQGYQVGTVAEYEVVQHVWVKAGEGPADGSAPVVTNQGELPHPETLHKSLDVVCQLLPQVSVDDSPLITPDHLDVVHVHLAGLLTLPVSPVVQGDHSELLFEMFDLVPPYKPELREAVTEQQQGLLPPLPPLLPLLPLAPGLHIVQPHSVEPDVVVAAVLRVR